MKVIQNVPSKTNQSQETCPDNPTKKSRKVKAIKSHSIKALLILFSDYCQTANARLCALKWSYWAIVVRGGLCLSTL